MSVATTTPSTPDLAAVALVEWLLTVDSEPAFLLAAGRALFQDERDARDYLALRLPTIAEELAPDFAPELVPLLADADWGAVADVLADEMPAERSRKILAAAATRVKVN